MNFTKGISQKVVVAGDINVGKSSLLNAIFGRGTEIFKIGDGITTKYPQKLMINGDEYIDLPGLNEYGCDYIKDFSDIYKSADHILMVFDDTNCMLSFELDRLINRIGELCPQGHFIAVINKCDRMSSTEKENSSRALLESLSKFLPTTAKKDVFCVSAKYCLWADAVQNNIDTYDRDIVDTFGGLLCAYPVEKSELEQMAKEAYANSNFKSLRNHIDDLSMYLIDRLNKIFSETLQTPLEAYKIACEKEQERNKSRSRTKKILVGSAIATGVIVGGAATLTAAVIFLPAAPGIIGGAAGLTGAAATSAGLATLGGGSIAAGGFGMAGGTATLIGTGAVATLTGGAVAGSIAGGSAYAVGRLGVDAPKRNAVTDIYVTAEQFEQACSLSGRFVASEHYPEQVTSNNPYTDFFYGHIDEELYQLKAKFVGSKVKEILPDNIVKITIKED